MRWLTVSMCGVAGLGAVGCKGDLPGAYWQLEQRTIEDTCNPQEVNASGEFEYRVVYELQDITVAIEDDEFAFGIVNGCNLEYQTVVWPEERDGFDIAWQMNGAAVVRKGAGDSCTPDGGGDWSGTETFTIVTSEDPDLSPGCTYTVEVTGTFIEEIVDKSAKDEDDEEGGLTP